jgi:hypothetical protein
LVIYRKQNFTSKRLAMCFNAGGVTAAFQLRQLFRGIEII